MTSENEKFKVDYAKSGQAICRGCESKNIADNKIARGTLRIGIVMQADRFDNHYELWHHLNCLFEIKIPTSLGEIEGIQRIRYADQLLIMQKIKSTETDEDIPSKRVKTDEVDSCNLASLIESQNENYYRIYDAMDARNPLVKERQKKELLKDILALNNQAQPFHKDSTQVFLEHVVDVITFGAMEPCSNCSKPGYIFDGTFGYVCNRRLYEFGEVKCNHREKAPRRFECIIPDNIKSFYPILNESRRPTTRILRNMEMPDENLSPVQSSSAVLSSSVVTSSSVVPGSSKVASSKQILKYGTVVDPLSGLENEAHVYSTNLEYAAILTKVNIQDNKNSFYKIQLLESDDHQKYWVFHHFGRIGLTGTNNLKQFDSLQDAIDVFEKTYLDKTSNTFGFDCFHAPFKFTKVDINYSDDIDLSKLMENNDIPSKLPERVQELIQLCFDTRIMKDMMIELELDTEKMPLGKLSQNQIDEALEILEKISHAYRSGGSEMAFIGLSNRFYTLIPHDYGVARPPVIKHLEQINEKLQMLANLADIQLAWNLLTTEGDVTKSPIDACYEKLKADIESVDRSSELYKFLENYLNNTHAPTHNFKLNVEDIFKVTRDGEATRYEKFQNTSNRYLLWHGSRIINFVGILSKGLKIAPPQVERTGDMFGNGIYFSDMATKSAQYCCVDRNNRYGLLLLCEVAMGDMQEYVRGFSPLHSTSNESVKGCGKTYPNPDENVVRDGVIVPCGKPLTDLTIQSDLRYNEYIIYDESKVNIKYLFKVKFQRR